MNRVAALSRFSVPPLHGETRELAAVASGRLAPELVLANARLLSTYSERMLPDRELWVHRGRIAAIRPAGEAIRMGLQPGRVTDLEGGILAPGLVDPHLHIESSMMTACAYAEAALLNGTTTIFCDSHEIANVSDVAGVEWMLEDARAAPLNVFLSVPSTVPATGPRFETAGGDLTPAKIGAIFDRWPEAVALGEKMDFVQVCEGDARSHAVLAEALRRGRSVSGHVYGCAFVAAYAASGVSDTHEAVSAEIADALIEAGVWIFLRGGPPTTPWHSLPAAIRAVTELGADPKRVCVCTDDRDADDLFSFGLDWVVREAMRAGLKRERAWSLGSLHPATRYNMDNEIGGLGGGRRADLVMLTDDMEVRHTWYGGALMVENKRPTEQLDRQLAQARFRYPDAAYRTVRLQEVLPPLTPALPAKRCRVNAIRTESASDITLKHAVLVLDARKSWDAHLDAHRLCFVSVIERHGRSGAVAHGLLQDFGLTEGAVASSVGHDAHNIVVAGRDENSMRVAVEAIRASGGGVVVVSGGVVAARVALPVAGLLSDKRAGDVAAETRVLKAAWHEKKCTLPFMGFNLLPLSVIPDIRITDKGLVTVPAMRQLPLFMAA